MKVVFPSTSSGLDIATLERYYKTYYAYVLNLFKYTPNVQIAFNNKLFVDNGVLTVLIDNNLVAFDYSDNLKLFEDVYNTPELKAYFKFHYSEGIHERFTKCFAFTPVSFHNWDEFFQYKSRIQYNCEAGLIISNRQKTYGNARVRRLGVRKLVRKFMYDSYTDKNIAAKIYTNDVMPQLQYWLDINNTVVAIFVPGCRNDILDRGHLQYLAFGCCGISPRIRTMLPFNKKLVPDVHYIECSGEYNDLPALITWVINNSNDCNDIGRNAAKLFLDTSTPQKLMSWIKDCINAS